MGAFGLQPFFLAIVRQLIPIMNLLWRGSRCDYAIGQAAFQGGLSWVWIRGEWAFQPHLLQIAALPKAISSNSAVEGSGTTAKLSNPSSPERFGVTVADSL